MSQDMGSNEGAEEDRVAYRAYVISSIRRGLECIETGRIVDEMDVERRLAWLDQCSHEELHERIDELADKCTEGTLTEVERGEYQAYVAAIDLVTILQAKARRALGRVD